MDDEVIKRIRKYYHALIILTMVTMTIPFIAYFDIYNRKRSISEWSNDLVKTNEIKNGIHVSSGLIVDDSFELVISNCTQCHSSKLIIQNRATRQGWENIIGWMQRTQNLWDLGNNQDLILDYLSKNYAPIRKGRRMPLSNIEWYHLDNQANK